MSSLFELVTAPGCFLPRASSDFLRIQEFNMVADGVAEWDRGPCGRQGLRATLKGVMAIMKLCPDAVPGFYAVRPRPTVSELVDALIDARDAVVSAAVHAVETAEKPDEPGWALDLAASFVRRAVHARRAAQDALDAEVARDANGEGG